MTQTWQKPTSIELSAEEAGITITSDIGLYVANNQILIGVNDRVAFDAIPAEARQARGEEGMLCKSGAWGNNQVVFQHWVAEEAWITITKDTDLYVANNQILIGVNDRVAFDAILAETQPGREGEGREMLRKSGAWGNNQVVFQYPLADEQSAA